MGEQRVDRQSAAGRPADKTHEKRQFENSYLSEAQLQSLIDEIEQTDGEYVPSPVSVEEQIWRKLARELPPEAGKATSGMIQQSVFPEDRMEDRIRRKRKELRRYTIRVALSAAASIAILLAFPLIQQTNLMWPQNGEQQMAERMQRQQKEYEKEKQVQESRDEKRREKFENRGEDREVFSRDGFESVISMMRRITK